MPVAFGDQFRFAGFKNRDLDQEQRAVLRSSLREPVLRKSGKRREEEREKERAIGHEKRDRH